jgi:flagellar FliL protein
MSEKKAEGEAGEAEAKPKSKKMLFIILGVVLLVAGAGVPMFLMGGGSEEELVVEEEHETPKRLETADLEVFVVNLSETSAFVKVHIVIEFDAALVEKQTMGEGGEGGGGGHGGGPSGGGGDAGPTIPPHFVKRMSQIKDVIIKILSAKRSDDLLTVEGKERLKDELLEGINEAVGLEEPPVTGVFFTEFMIQ